MCRLKEIDMVRHIIDIDPHNLQEKIKILIVGYFAEKKGHEFLFKALKKLNRNDLEVWVVGEMTPDVVAVDCRRLAKDLGVDHQVAFFGEQRGNALWALFRECDVLCMPSRTGQDGDREGFPTVIAEAMAFGKPVVGTRHAGIPEMLDEVLLADEQNVDQIAEALARICDSEEMRREVGEKNKKLVAEHFSPRNNDLYEQMLLDAIRDAKTADSSPAKLAQGAAD